MKLEKSCDVCRDEFAFAFVDSGEASGDMDPEYVGLATLKELEGEVAGGLRRGGLCSVVLCCAVLDINNQHAILLPYVKRERFLSIVETLGDAKRRDASLSPRPLRADS